LSSRSASFLFAAIALTSIALSLGVIGTGISLDDPFIGLRYARNLLDGHGLVYNAGDPPVEGYTAYFWILVAALGMWLGREPLGFWQAGAVAAMVGTLWATWHLGRRAEWPPARALVAPALLGVHVAFVFYPMTGMETAFFTFVVTLGALLVARRAASGWSGAALLGGVLILICLTRFDGLGLAGLLLAWILVIDRDPRSFLRAVVPLAAGLAIYNGWRLAFYGDPLPNTFYAKSSSLAGQLRDGAAYLARFGARGGPFALLLAAPLVLRRRVGRAAGLCAWMSLGQLAYVLVVGGDWMPYYRFVLPVLPLLCVLVQETFWAAVDRLHESGRTPSATLVAVALAGVLAIGLVPLAASTFVREPPEGRYWHPAEAREVARALTRRIPREALVAVEWAGIIPFYLDQPVLDIFGLSDKRITSGEFPGTRMGRGITAEFLTSLGPDLVVFTARPLGSAEEAAATGPEIRGEGLWITGFYASLLEPEHGYEACVVELAEARYWPVLARRDLPYREGLCVAVE
jgi:hypothetical protein